jgi:hypothetical protein
MLEKIKQRYLEQNPEFNDERYEVKVEYVLHKTKANTILNCISKGKFCGKHGKESDVGAIRIFRIHVTDLSLPAGKVINREIAGDEVNLSNCQQWADTKELQDFIQTQLESINTERLERSVLGAADAALGNYKISTRFSSLSVPAELGTWSKADKEFFKWWARDPSGEGQIYMKFKGQLLPVPIYESEGSVRIKKDPQFWSNFWKVHRGDILRKTDDTKKYCYEFRENQDASEIVDITDLRLGKNSEGREITVVEMLHTIWPKEILNRMSIREVYKHYVDESGNEKSVLHRLTIALRPRGSDTETPQTNSEEKWQEVIGTIVPNIPRDELEEVKNFSNDPKVLAIHYANINGFVPSEESLSSGDVPNLPPAWDKFFETRLGDNRMSQLYRIAKWIEGCLDETNFSRQILIVAGSGKDGKSIFSNVVKQGFNDLVGNPTFAVTLPAEATESKNTQNGLLSRMTSRVLFVPEVNKVTDFVRRSIVKSITGSDDVSTQVKFRSDVTRNMAGTKIMAVTNFTTYMADVFVDSRVSPICFTRKDLNEPDFDQIKIKQALLDEFSEFVKWCFIYARMQDKALGYAYNSEAPVFCDNLPDEPFNTKAQWESVGFNSKGEPMFKYRRADEEEEVEQEYLSDLLQRVSTEDPNGKCFNLDIRTALQLEADSIGLRGLDLTSSKFFKAIGETIKSVYPNAASFMNHGRRGWKGFSLKAEEQAKTVHYKSRRASELSTQMPAK